MKTEPKIVHTHPVGDQKRHVISGWPKKRCWCGPAKETFTNGNVLLVHNAADGRK